VIEEKPMISKLESKNPPKDHEEKWGSYNDFPPGWTKITIKELVQDTRFSSYAPLFIEHRQMLPTSGKNRTMVDAWLYFYDDGTGIGIVCNYWGEKISYFRFGCKHTYQGISSEECQKRGIYHGGRCYHVSVCTKCGHLNVVDSSD